MMKTSFTLNGKAVQVETAADATLLWTLRDTLKMTGAKYGCGASLCGVCTVHLDGMPARACVTPISMVAGRPATTIEGLKEEALHPLQKGSTQGRAGKGRNALKYDQYWELREGLPLRHRRSGFDA